MDILISVNGVIGPAAQMGLPALDRGFLFGDAVFETLVAFGPRLMDPHKHLERLRFSADALGIPVPWSDAELLFELQSLAEALACPKAVLRLCVTRGSGLGLMPTPGVPPNRIVHASPAQAPKATWTVEGLRLKIRPSPHASRGPQPKTPSYLPAIQALRTAAADGCDDILWATAEGEVQECSASNIFFIGREGDMIEVVTPASSSGILEGITRARITALMRKARVLVTERPVLVDELARFDEAFTTSSVRGLLPVQSIDRQRYHSRRPQAIFRHIERLHAAWLAVETGQRLDWHTGMPVPE